MIMNSVLTERFKEMITKFEKYDEIYFNELEQHLTGGEAVIRSTIYGHLVDAYREARSIVRELDLQIKLQGVDDGKNKD